MIFSKGIPSAVGDLILSGRVTEFATMSTAGVPIDTPTLYFANSRLGTIDLATGLAYPAKADRARRYPKVGLLIEGDAGQPIVSIAGMAAVRDADLQANVLRFLAEAGEYLPGNPGWALARDAIWYWARIFIEITPLTIRWWSAADAMDGAPTRWDAPDNTPLPMSDATPPGHFRQSSVWPTPAWRELAEQALASSDSAHVSFCDDAGFPLPFRATAVRHTADGFRFRLPIGLPVAAARRTTLSFAGIRTFVGIVTGGEGRYSMAVERALPQLPTVVDGRNLWAPPPDVRAKFMDRLRQEAARRGQPVPIVPVQKPAANASNRGAPIAKV